MALPVLKFNVGDTKTLRFRLLKSKEDPTPVDLTGLTFRFFARQAPGDPEYKIDPIDATIPDPLDGRFIFEGVDMPADAFIGLYWIEREDGAANVDTLQPAEGTEIRILDK